MVQAVEVKGLDDNAEDVRYGSIAHDGQAWRLNPSDSPILKQLVEKPIALGGKFFTYQEPETFLDALCAQYKSAYFRVVPMKSAKLSLEYYGTEPPGEGWRSAGDGKWVKGEEELKPPPPEEEPRRRRGGPRIAVVGGGPGGMFCTYILNQRLPDAAVTIFESTEDLGGKIRTDEFTDGTAFEAGVAELYEYKGADGADPLRLLIEDDLGLSTVDMSGGAVVVRDKLVRDLDEVERVFGYDTRKRIERFHAKMTELMPLERYSQRWQPDNTHPWADKTFRECVYEEVGDDPVAVEYLFAAVHSDLATEPHTCNGLNGIKNVLMDNEKYMQLYHVKGGIERVAEELERKLDAFLRTEHRVVKVAKKGKKYDVTFRNPEEETETETFDYVFLCLPNHWLTQLSWDDGPLKEAIHKIMAHYDLPAHYLRVSLLFRENWWKKHEIPGDYWMMDMFGGCCAYDESARWKSVHGHVLSFLLGGADALLQCSANQDDDEIIAGLLDALPTWMRDDAKEHFVEGLVDRYVGSINAMPGGWPAPELRAMHIPEPSEHPGLFLVGDYLLDSTLNAALTSASTAVDLLCEQRGVRKSEMTEAIEEVTEDSRSLSL